MQKHTVESMSVIKPPDLLYYPDFYPDPIWLRAVLLLTDNVKRIVPDDVALEDSDALKIISGEIGGLSEFRPKQNHIEPYGNAAAWLEKTLDILGNETRLDHSQKVKILISNRGSYEFPGKVFLFDKKLSDRVRSLLEKNRLIDHNAHKLAAALSDVKNSVIVPAAAANAILSMIADGIARDEGFIPITDQPLDFAMNSLSGLDIYPRAPHGASQGILAGAFASILVPKEIGEISSKDYIILRHRSEDLRNAFGKFVRQCHETCRLDLIENTTKLQQKILDCAQEVDEEFKKFQLTSNKTLRFIKNWWPLTIGGILTLGKDFVPPELSLSIGGLLQVVKFSEKIFVPNSNQDREKVFNLAAELGNDIRALPRVSQLLSA